MSHHHERILTAHPRRGALTADKLARYARAIFDCAETCAGCADSCLAEKDVARMTRCIRLCIDCNEVCETTGRLLTRQTETSWELVRAQVHACVAACRICAAECDAHTAEHCQLCAEECRRCEESCHRLLGEIPSR